MGIFANRNHNLKKTRILKAYYVSARIQAARIKADQYHYILYILYHDPTSTCFDLLGQTVSSFFITERFRVHFLPN